MELKNQKNLIILNLNLVLAGLFFCKSSANYLPPAVETTSPLGATDNNSIGAIKQTQIKALDDLEQKAAGASGSIESIAAQLDFAIPGNVIGVFRNYIGYGSEFTPKEYQKSLIEILSYLFNLLKKDQDPKFDEIIKELAKRNAKNIAGFDEQTAKELSMDLLSIAFLGKDLNGNNNISYTSSGYINGDFTLRKEYKRHQSISGIRDHNQVNTLIAMSIFYGLKKSPASGELLLGIILQDILRDPELKHFKEKFSGFEHLKDYAKEKDDFQGKLKFQEAEQILIDAGFDFNNPNNPKNQQRIAEYFDTRPGQREDFARSFFSGIVNKTASPQSNISLDESLSPQDQLHIAEQIAKNKVVFNVKSSIKGLAWEGSSVSRDKDDLALIIFLLGSELRDAAGRYFAKILGDKETSELQNMPARFVDDPNDEGLEVKMKSYLDEKKVKPIKGALQYDRDDLKYALDVLKILRYSTIKVSSESEINNRLKNKKYLLFLRQLLAAIAEKNVFATQYARPETRYAILKMIEMEEEEAKKDISFAKREYGLASNAIADEGKLEYVRQTLREGGFDLDNPSNKKNKQLLEKWFVKNSNYSTEKIAHTFFHIIATGKCLPDNEEPFQQELNPEDYLYIAKCITSKNLESILDSRITSEIFITLAQKEQFKYAKDKDSLALIAFLLRPELKDAATRLFAGFLNDKETALKGIPAELAENSNDQALESYVQKQVVKKAKAIEGELRYYIDLPYRVCKILNKPKLLSDISIGNKSEIDNQLKNKQYLYFLRQLINFLDKETDVFVFEYAKRPEIQYAILKMIEMENEEAKKDYDYYKNRKYGLASDATRESSTNRVSSEQGAKELGQEGLERLYELLENPNQFEDKVKELLDENLQNPQIKKEANIILDRLFQIIKGDIEKLETLKKQFDSATEPDKKAEILKNLGNTKKDLIKNISENLEKIVNEYLPIEVDKIPSNIANDIIYELIQILKNPGLSKFIGSDVQNMLGIFNRIKWLVSPGNILEAYQSASNPFSLTKALLLPKDSSLLVLPIRMISFVFTFPGFSLFRFFGKSTIDGLYKQIVRSITAVFDNLKEKNLESDETIKSKTS